MPTVPVTRSLILDLLREHGPMTSAQVAQELDWPRSRVNGCIAKARGDHGTRYFVIVGYHAQRGRGGREAPVYAPGPGKDAPRPVFEEKKRQQRYRDKHRVLINLRSRVRRGKAVTPFDQLFKLSKKGIANESK